MPHGRRYDLERDRIRPWNHVAVEYNDFVVAPIVLSVLKHVERSWIESFHGFAVVEDRNVGLRIEMSERDQILSRQTVGSAEHGRTVGRIAPLEDPEPADGSDRPALRIHAVAVSGIPGPIWREVKALGYCSANPLTFIEHNMGILRIAG